MQRVVYFFALISGACALVYEVAWVRALGVDLGATVYAMATVLSVFMGGLALGAHVFGRWSDRTENPWRLYGCIELLLGLYAALLVGALTPLHAFSAWLLRDTALSQMQAGLFKFLLAAATLAPLTVLIGGTFPVMSKIVAESRDTLGRRLATLYGINTLGAVLGCLGEAFFLIVTLGVQGSILLAAAVNGVMGLMALALSTRAAATPAPTPRETSDAPAPISAGQPPPRAGWIYAVAFGSGFGAMAAQVLWTRLFINLLSGAALVYATVLAAFLTGIALGSLWIARHIDRWRRLEGALGGLLLCAAGWLIASALGRVALGRVFQYLHTLGGSHPRTVALCLGAVFLLVGLPSAVLGAVFPILLRWGEGSLSTLGSRVGAVLLANTLGAIAGSFAAGFFFLTYLGLAPSLVVVAATYALLATPVFARGALRLIAASALVGCVALLCAPSVRRPILWFNGGFTGVRPVPLEDTLFVADGPEGAVGVSEQDGVRALTINGVIVAETSQNDLWDLLLKAHLPMLLHERPRKVAVIGLGAGISLGAVEAYDVQRIDCAEISPQVVEAQHLFADFNQRSWEDDRLNMWINDGRHFLLTTSQRYDVINVDPVDPPACNQYTQEFFQLCHDRLNPGGLMVQWVPLFHLWPEHLRVVLGGFLKVFPHSTLWYDGTSLLLIGRQRGPLRIDLPRFVRRASEPRVRASLAMIGQPHPLILLATYVGGPETLKKLAGETTTSNTDDVPYIEYRLLLSGPPDDKGLVSNLALFAGAFEPCSRWLPVAELGAQDISKLRQARALLQGLLQVRILALQDDHRGAQRRLEQLTAQFDLRPSELKLFRPFYQEGSF